MDVESSLWHAELYTPTKVLPERYWGKKPLSLSYLLEKVWRNTMPSQKYQYWNNAWTDRRIWCEGKLYSETIGHLTFVYLILFNMDYGARIFIMFQLYPQYTSWRGNYLSPASILLLFIIMYFWHAHRVCPGWQWLSTFFFGLLLITF